MMATRRIAWLAAHAQAAPYLLQHLKQTGPTNSRPHRTRTAFTIDYSLRVVRSMLSEASCDKLLPPSTVAIENMWSFWNDHKALSLEMQSLLTHAREDLVFKKHFDLCSPSDQARILSSSQKGANTWLTVVPSSRRLFLSDFEFRTVMRLHLGLTPTTDMPPACACKSDLKEQPLHHLHCASFTGALITSRHDRIVRLLANWARKAGAIPVVEPAMDGASVRVDLAIHAADGTSLIDVVVSDPTAQSIVGAASKTPLASADRQATIKRNNYESSNLHQPVTPFSIECFGAMTSDSLKVVDGLAAMPMAKEIPHFRMDMLAELSCELQRGNAWAISAGLARSRTASSRLQYRVAGHLRQHSARGEESRSLGHWEEDRQLDIGV